MSTDFQKPLIDNLFIPFSDRTSCSAPIYVKQKKIQVTDGVRPGASLEIGVIVVALVRLALYVL